MEFGFQVRTSRAGTSPEGLIRQAQLGEALGFDIVAVPDHVVVPRTIKSTYPYSKDGSFGGAAAGECLEQLTVCMFLAAHTSRIRVLTSVMVMPHRPPVLAAKILATIDVLSRGRLIVGVGAGWMKEEFEALGAPPYEHRGTVVVEYLQAFRELWTADNPVFEGKYARVSDVKFLPKPVQKPHPPIWVGGESPAALRRAGRLGNAWYPIGNNPSFPMDTIARLEQALDAVRGHAEASGRHRDEVGLAYNAQWHNDRTASTAHGGQRPLLSGSPEQVAADIRKLNEIGVQHLIVGFGGESLDETLLQMDRFAVDVKPLVDSR